MRLATAECLECRKLFAGSDRANSLKFVDVYRQHGRCSVLWLQNDVPPRYLKNALISPAISHVSMEGEPSLADKFRLVHFMAQMLDLTEPRESVSH